MAAIDAEAPEPIDELIARAAWATARAAIDLLDRPPYGARIAVLVGKGNNGADGREAIPHLRRVGARCTLFELGTGASGPARPGPSPWRARSRRRPGDGRRPRPHRRRRTRRDSGST
jgi:NAD(P)H-hydrate repair Nnr-like enzyme with NAD(P)H-hydrate epimerase domain